jgi:V/A-type H+-transporting ATPase subunit D
MRLTKTELRTEQTRLSQLSRYLPTLQLKKSMLQVEVENALGELTSLQNQFNALLLEVKPYERLLNEKVQWDLLAYAEVIHVKKRYENIAGVEIPEVEAVVFKDDDYPLTSTPAWFDQALEKLRSVVISRETIRVAEEKKRALEKELREVSIRVNLFEKILIPRSEATIKKIKIFLGDQQLAAIAQAKVAKRKLRS